MSVYVIQESDEEITPPAPAPKTEMLESSSLAQTSPHHSVSQHVYTKPKSTDPAKPGLFVCMRFYAHFSILVCLYEILCRNHQLRGHIPAVCWLACSSRPVVYTLHIV